MRFASLHQGDHQGNVGPKQGGSMV